VIKKKERFTIFYSFCDFIYLQRLQAYWHIGIEQDKETTDDQETPTVNLTAGQEMAH